MSDLKKLLERIDEAIRPPRERFNWLPQLRNIAPEENLVYDEIPTSADVLHYQYLAMNMYYSFAALLKNGKVRLLPVQVTPAVQILETPAVSRNAVRYSTAENNDFMTDTFQVERYRRHCLYCYLFEYQYTSQ